MVDKEYIRIVENSDTAVLMIHGIVGTPAHFRHFLHLIPEDWSIYNLLLDGHGKGVDEFAASSMKKWKAQVDSRLAEILATHRRVLIVAHSMGTLFAIQAAIRHPDRIPRLFLLQIPLRPFLPPSTAIISVKNALGIAKPSDAPAMAMLEGCGVNLSPWLPKYIFWIPRFLELLAEVHRTRKLLPQLAVPTRSYPARHDELVAFSVRKDLENHPHIRNTLLPDSGHFVYAPSDLAVLQAELREVIAEMEKL